MSYSEEQFKRHEAYVESQLADATHQDRSEAKQWLRMNWPEDKEVEGYVKNVKVEISKRATPEELEEAFKNFHL